MKATQKPSREPPGPVTIAVLNQKGGVGKTTLATNLAACALLAGKRTLLLDLDAQGSALNWYAARPDNSTLRGLAVTKVDKALRAPQLRDIMEGYDVVIIDGPPKLGDMTRSGAVASDVVLMPVRPGPFDMWALQDTLELLNQADSIRADAGRRALARLFVVSCSTHNTVLSRQAPTALAEAGEVATLPIRQRVLYPEAAAHGESVLTMAPDGDAAREIRSLYRELCALAGPRGKAAA
jgi:chromosome partitioning protein